MEKERNLLQKWAGGNIKIDYWKPQVNVTGKHNGLVALMERVSDARMAEAKPHGWVYVTLGMGGARPSSVRPTAVNK
jgi:hypothetical protein